MNPTDLMSPDLVRVAFVIGMVISVFLYEKSHLTTGSIVVPGFLGIHVFEPLVVVVSLLNAWMCFALVHIVVPRFVMMKSKSKFYALIAVSVLFQLGITVISQLPMELAFAGNALLGFGYVIPGLIAHDMYRNGPLKTSIHTMFASYIVGGLVMGCAVWAPDVSLNLQTVKPVPLNFSLPLVLALSTLGTIVLKLNTSLRSGGYITAAYFVFFGLEPFVTTTIFLVALANYFICRHGIMPTMIIFGRRKFAMFLIVGSLLMWATTMFLASAGIQIPIANHPGYAGVLILLPGLIANDMQRASIPSVCFGLGLLSSWIFVLATLCYEIKLYSRPEYVFPLIGFLCGMALVLLVLRKQPDMPSPKQPLLVHSP